MANEKLVKVISGDTPIYNTIGGDRKYATLMINKPSFEGSKGTQPIAMLFA